jgi:Lon protease-like protein
MPIMPMFPLGSVLFPSMPTALRVFEERYIVMLSTILGDEPPEFGIVLIERGSEVGGGEQRFPIGTIAQITRVETSEGFIGLIAQGDRRIEVTSWLDDDPYPRAEVRDVPALVWDEEVRPLLERAEQLVRRTIARASEFVEQQWPADIELSDDPVDAAWQLAGIAPLGPLDQVRLLRSSSVTELLSGIIEATESAAEMLTVDWGDDDFPTFPDEPENRQGD